MHAVDAQTPMQQRPAVPRLLRSDTAKRTLSLLSAAGAGLGLWLIAVRDPNQPGFYPLCPYFALTDHYCPGCGTLRALHALTQGDFVGALSRNALTVLLALPLVVLLWAQWTVRVWRGRARRWLVPAWLIWMFWIVVAAFTIIRNTGWGQVLAP